MTELQGPLDGVRVLELSQLIAGPSAALLLADYGADVIKVEPPEGDAGRELRSVVAADAAEAPTFLAYNRNKRLVRLDLRRPEDHDVVLGLVDEADVVIESSRPGAMERLGLGPDAMAERNPRLVYASVSGFGWIGADRERRGVDLVIQAESGIMSLTGPVEGPPTKVGFTMVDAATGHALCHAILAALWQRERTGKGAVVRLSLRDVAIHLQAAPVMEYLVSGTPPPRSGNAAPMTAPADLFTCRDGALVISAYQEHHWQALAEVLGAEELLVDERFATKAARVRHRDELTAAIEERLGEHPAEHWLPRLQERGVVAGEVKDLARVVDESVAEEGVVVALNEGSGHAVRTPVQLDGGRPVPASAPEEVDAARLRWR